MTNVASRVPDRPAIVWRDQSLTFEEFVGRTRKFANLLVARWSGHVRERQALQRWESGQDHLAICMRNRPEWLEVMLGSYEARIAPFNVNYRYVEDELVQVLRAGSPRAVVFEAVYRASSDRSRAQGTRLRLADSGR